MDWWWTLLESMDDHDGQAAWAQAIGSVVAIVASGFFALWVPLHIRQLDQKGVAQRSLVGCLYVVDNSISSWNSLLGILESKAFHPGTPGLIDGRIAAVRALAAEIPRVSIGPDALLELNVCLQAMDTLGLVTARLHETDGAIAIEDLPFKSVIARLHLAEEAFRGMVPVRAFGHWMGAPPGWPKSDM